MPIELLTGDVLNSGAEAVTLTIDGAAKGMGGNISRQFARRWPEDWEDIERALRFPIALGRTVAIAHDGDCPFKLILFASTLHHVGVVDDEEKRGIIRSAFGDAIHHAAEHRVSSMATAVMTGGWRLPAVQALRAMAAMARSLSALAPALRLEIYLPGDMDLASTRDAGREEGWLW